MRFTGTGTMNCDHGQVDNSISIKVLRRRGGVAIIATEDEFRLRGLRIAVNTDQLFRFPPGSVRASMDARLYGSAASLRGSVAPISTFAAVARAGASGSPARPRFHLRNGARPESQSWAGISDHPVSGPEGCLPSPGAGDRGFKSSLRSQLFEVPIVPCSCPTGSRLPVRASSSRYASAGIGNRRR